MKHYYIVTYKHSNGTVLRQITHKRRRDIFNCYLKGVYYNHILAITKISKREAKKCGYQL